MGYPVINGHYSLNTDGGGQYGHNANLYQDFSSAAGVSYTLCFDWEGWSFWSTPTTNALKVSLTDPLTSTSLFTGLYYYDQATRLQSHRVSAQFKGTGTILRLRIEEAPESGYNDNTFIADNFSVSMTPVITLTLQAVRVADDGGGRQTHITPEEVQQWVTFANSVWANAGIQFAFEPSRDFVDVRSTLVNNMTGVGDANWAAEVGAANDIAARYAGKLTVLFRWGPGNSPTGGGFSWWDYSFVVCPGFNDTWHCGQQNRTVLAHEVGHHLGLPHTFGGAYATVDEAASVLAANGNNPNVFDGDGFSDTPPHPSIVSQECPNTNQIVINGILFTLPRSNIMSYYFEADSLTLQQADRVRWMAQNYLAHDLLAPSNKGLINPLEAELLPILQTQDAVNAVQQMAGFGVGWSADAQVWCGTGAGGFVTFSLPVSEAGLTQIDLYATQAPDFGTFRFYLDDQLIGGTFDAYAPVVLASGCYSLGSAYLFTGNHRLKIQSSGKNVLSSSYHLGVDAFVLTRVEAQPTTTNIARAGHPILGFQNAVDSTPGTELYHAGTRSSINDGNLSSRVDNFSAGSDAGQGVSFVGILWPSRRFEQIGNAVLTLAAFFDGGWFGPNGRGPGWGGSLTASDLVEPMVQVSIDQGLTWTNVACTSDYLQALTGQFVGGPPANPCPLTTSFTCNPPITGINGLRVIGPNGGAGDANGFLGVFELEVDGTPPLLQPVWLLNPRMSSGQFCFEFDSQAGGSHTVQYKVTLSEAAWQTLATINGDGTRISVTNALAGGQRFYRVVTN